MTIASAIVQQAYREGNLIAAGTNPTAAEIVEAVALLNSYIVSILGFELGENLTDWLVPAPQRTATVAANFPQLPMACNPPSNVWPYPPKNSRIVFGGVTATVYFPGKPDDGSRMAIVQGSGAGDSGAVGQILTLNGNGRTIETASTKTYTFASPVFAPRQWLYRADLGDWVAIIPLASGDALQFPADLDDLFITALSIRLSPRYGKTPNALTTGTFKFAMMRAKARYKQSADTTYNSGDIRNAPQSFDTGFRWS